MPIEKLTKVKLKKMSKKEVQSFTTKEEIESLVSNIIQVANGDPEIRKLLAWLTPEQIPLISVKIIPLLINNNGQLLLATLSQKQIQALTKEQIQALTTDQIKKMSYDTFTNKVKIARGAFALPMGIINVLGGGEFILSIAAGLYIENYQIEALTPQQIRWFTSEQIQAFDSKQIAAFDSKQIAAFDSKQIAAFNETQISHFPKEEYKNDNLTTFDIVKDNANTIDIHDKLSINQNQKIQHSL